MPSTSFPEKISQAGPSLRMTRGRSLPLGTTALADGVNFVLLCRHGMAVWLVLYPIEGPGVLAEISLNPQQNRTGDHWHILVAGLPSAFRYGWRVDGPQDRGHYFNPEIVLLDPSATEISDGAIWGQHIEPYRHCTTRRSVFFRRHFDWKDDEPPRIPFEDSIIYELHVRGFTCHPSSGVKQPGTFAGLVEKIPYLKSLGVTAVELLPIHEFDENDCPFENPLTGERLRNFWGYNSFGFAAPKAAYASSSPQHGQVYEFREMVRAFHQAGIEVILDVVFNHTGEGDYQGRTYHFRGMDNQLYYMLGPKGNYLNFTGCGNTVNCNHPVVRQLLMTCLHYWVADMHIDGLRFDLASVLGRDYQGNVLLEPPVVEMISEDSVLRDTKLIAEPWDAVGLYQVGRFPFGQRWSEWNGQYRDAVRRFWRGDPGLASQLATRLSGSSDLYQSTARLPRHSINFITCHDGFTLQDLVSYNCKHNEANGEGNRDGMDENLSWNCGVEGRSDSPVITNLRRRQAKNLMATLLLSQGVPMILAGDEFLRSQQGNNNAWCQDNEVSWVNWKLAEENADFLRFVREMIALRKRHPALRRRGFFEGKDPKRPQKADIIWHGVDPETPDFSERSLTLAYALNGRETGRESDADFYVACNASADPVLFRIPPSPTDRPWHGVVDTSLRSPNDFLPESTGPLILPMAVYPVAPHTLIVLISTP